MNERLSPAKMAEIYFNRQHFAAVKIVQGKLDGCGGPKTSTYQYWAEVLRILEARANSLPSYQGGKQETKGEAHV